MEALGTRGCSPASLSTSSALTAASHFIRLSSFRTVAPPQRDDKISPIAIVLKAPEWRLLEQ